MGFKRIKMFDSEGQAKMRAARERATALFKEAAKARALGEIEAAEHETEANGLLQSTALDEIRDLQDEDPEAPRARRDEKNLYGWTFYYREGLVFGIEFEDVTPPRRSETPQEEIARLQDELDGAELTARAKRVLLEERRKAISGEDAPKPESQDVERLKEAEGNRLKVLEPANGAPGG